MAKSITFYGLGVITAALGAAGVLTAQQVVPTPHSFSQYVSVDGVAIERLIELGSSRRNDLLAARQRVAIAKGRLMQAGFRPNPTLDAEYGSPRFLGGEAERNFSVGLSQTFELGGKRSRRVSVARLEVQQARADVLLIERQITVEIRTSYANVLASSRQLDLLQ
ncbi:MAG: TolC family protein, partial [Pyrinomonadaceae bacterium]